MPATGEGGDVAVPVSRKRPSESEDSECVDAAGTSASVWGSHVMATAKRPKVADAVPKTNAPILAKLSMMSSESSNSTRTSLSKKKRRRSPADTFDTLSVDGSASHLGVFAWKRPDAFDTLSQDGAASQDSPAVAVAKPRADPLARFDPEISMDTASGAFDRDDDDFELGFPAMGVASKSVGVATTKSSVRGAAFERSQSLNFYSFGGSKLFGSKERNVDDGWLKRCAESESSPTKSSAESHKETIDKENITSNRSTTNEPADEDHAPKSRECSLVKSPPGASGIPSASVGSSGILTDSLNKRRSDPGALDSNSAVVKAAESSSATISPVPNSSTCVRIAIRAKTSGASQASKAGALNRSVSVSSVETTLGTGRKSRISSAPSKASQGQKISDENFVKINLKKKTYVRGKKTMTGSKFRRMEWKRKKAMKESSESGKGKKKGKGADAENVNGEENGDDVDMFEDEQPTIHQAEAEASSHLEIGGEMYEEVFNDDDNAVLLEACEEAMSMSFTDDDIRRALDKFGYSGFRPGQEEPIRRILKGESSLVLLATGTGKSLIYQLPAYLYAERRRCITLVVSPLVSLMEDQVVGLPDCLRAACLHSNQTESQRNKVVDQLRRGRLHFLLVSPETMASNSGILRSVSKDMPPIAFVCIDEAHCVSEWSHNFRPAYLRLAKIIRDGFGVKTILGLTATAPLHMVNNMCNMLGICPETGVTRGQVLPDNLLLSASKEEDRDLALISLLKGHRFSQCQSIIVYCTRREDCVRLATLIRTHLQDSDISNSSRKKGKRALSFTAEAYHAGLTAGKRRVVQRDFMSGSLRIIVATVAFGMGIDKSDIRAIVHYNMPKTMESYIQEVGRAGRDGEPAHCHLFLEAKDLNELKRHIYSNSVEGVTIRRLLEIIFDSGLTDHEVRHLEQHLGVGVAQRLEYREVAAPISRTVELLDLPEENVATLLCYLENEEHASVALDNHVYATCKVTCYNGPAQLKALASASKVMAAALELRRLQGFDVDGSRDLVFPVVSVAAALGWDSGAVKRDLKQLQWRMAGGRWHKTGVSVEFSDLAFHLRAKVGLGESEQDALKEFLERRVVARERMELNSLNRIFRSLVIVAHASYLDCSDQADLARSDKLKGFVRDYFEERDPGLDAAPPAAARVIDNESSVRADIRAFIGTHTDQMWTGRAVARVFHGIPSPNFPAQVWGRVRRFWRSHLDADFNALCRLAKEEIVSVRRCK